ncbi:Hint domain-containing protein, partial [Acidisphaera rubrifaciens]|uniref:Hint domain-containing protein n=1 Tax=Acidisphaera rubrifaciens TaxID=50715 RepID=UPI000662292F
QAVPRPGGGKGLGGAIFLQGSFDIRQPIIEKITLAAQAGQTLDIAGTVADQTGSGGLGITSGAGRLVINGPGTVRLDARNTFVGDIIVNGGTLDLAAAGAGGGGGIFFSNVADPTISFTPATAPTNPILGFLAGDTLLITGFVETSETYVGSALTLFGNGGPITLDLPVINPADLVVATAGGDTTVTSTQPACYAAGTRIATARGEVAVEHLAVGDRVRTVDAAWRPVAWIGHFHVDCAAHPRPAEVWPVRVRAHALADGIPARDLFLSPDHALFIDGVLIPVRHLIDGDAVARVPVASIDYWHLALETHDVVLAEGMPAETFLDDGRDRLPPGAGSPDPALLWEAQACAPLVVVGPAVEAVRTVLARRGLCRRGGVQPPRSAAISASAATKSPFHVVASCAPAGAQRTSA